MAPHRGQLERIGSMAKAKIQATARGKRRRTPVPVPAAPVDTTSTSPGGNGAPGPERLLLPDSWPKVSRVVSMLIQPDCGPADFLGELLDARSEEPLRQLSRLAATKVNRRPRVDKQWHARVQDWLAGWSGSEAAGDVELAAVVVTAATVLPQLVARLDPLQAQHLLDQLLRIAQQAQAAPPAGASELLSEQWLAVELPLWLAFWFAPQRPSPALFRQAVERLDTSLRESLDGEGQLHAQHLPLTRTLCRSWTVGLTIWRALRGARGLEKVKLAADARIQFSWLIRQMLCGSRGDGAGLFTAQSGSLSATLNLAHAALRIAPDNDQRRLVKAWSGGKRVSEASLPWAGDHSEWAQQAVLRSSWQRDAQMCAIRWWDRRLELDVSAGKRSLLRGEWTCQPVVDGHSLQPASEWESICWEVDEDIEYLELEMQFEGDWKVQRQIALAREDGLLLLADAILGPAAERLEYQSSLLHAPEVEIKADSEATELKFVVRRPIATLIPLAIPEWRRMSHNGSLDQTELLTKVTQRGRNAYVPLVLDLDSKRQRKPLTWRQLTVAEQLEIVSPECAAAYRLQIGKRQWVFYRSLEPAGNRTFMGQNLVSEFLWARFLKTGEIETLIEIE
jgi:hypothetical protein